MDEMNAQKQEAERAAAEEMEKNTCLIEKLEKIRVKIYFLSSRG